jgi:hypothetical protein
VRHEINIGLGKKVRRVTSGYFDSAHLVQSHILSALCGTKDYITMHITVITALNLKKVKSKSKRPSSLMERGLGIIDHVRRTKGGATKRKLSGWESNPGYLR